MLSQLLSILIGFVGFLILLIYENSTNQKENQQQVSVSETPSEDIPADASKHLHKEVKDKTSNKSGIEPDIQENTSGKPSDVVKSKSIHLESNTGPLAIDQVLVEEEPKKHPKDEQNKVEPQPEPAREVPKRLCEEVKAQSSPLKLNQELPVYQVPLEEVQINISGCKRFIFGKDSVKTNRTIMVMGATGAGKSTLIDGMINYILGIQRSDTYRFKLVREVQKETQAVSQTSEVTVYKLNHQDGFQIDFSLTIIDTPGFGDTRGIKRDMEITEQIRNLFTSKSGVLELDAVCFVVQAALARLTPSQRYVFDSVLSIFGKDIAENIRVLVTFADGKRPPVLEAITASGVPCPEDKGGAPLHFKFNNSALFSDCNSQTRDEDEEEDEEDFDEMFWKMGQKSMKRFFVALNKIPTKSLMLTKEVLTERKQLENLVESLQKQVRVGLSKLEEIRQKRAILQTHEAEISRNANFEYEVTIIEPHQILKKENTFITNCQQCSFTCHENCLFANDDDKDKCGAMGKDGKCTICPGKCIWSVHFNQKYKWDYRKVTKKETVQELKDQYNIAKGEKNAAELILSKLEDEYDEVQVEVTVMIDDSSNCLNRLKEIALKPDPLSAPDYVDMLIEGEKSEARPGWKDRVESLRDIKKKAETMVQVDRKEVLLNKNIRTTDQNITTYQKLSMWNRMTSRFSK